jgi:hypothetical protein
MVKVVKFIRNDLIHGSIVYAEGEIAGFDDLIADRLIQRGFAVLHLDGRPRPVGGPIPDVNGYTSGFGLPGKPRAQG